MGLQRGLGGGVRVETDHEIRPRDDRAGDVDDAAPAGVQHARQHGGGERGRCDDVALEGTAKLGDRDRGSRAERLDGRRVVDQDVHAACRDRGRGRTAAVLFVAEVGGNDPDPPGCSAPAEQDRLRLRQLAGGPGDQDQRGTGVR